MTVIVLIATATGLRGHVTRWLVEVAPGVFVGNPSARVRDELWKTIVDRVRAGQAILIHSSRTEQRWVAQTAGVDRWVPVDFDGLTLFRRPSS
jgi:CRISPR-associated protein Cas2